MNITSKRYSNTPCKWTTNSFNSQIDLDLMVSKETLAESIEKLKPKPIKIQRKSLSKAFSNLQIKKAINFKNLIIYEPDFPTFNLPPIKKNPVLKKLIHLKKPKLLDNRKNDLIRRHLLISMSISSLTKSNNIFS